MGRIGLHDIDTYMKIIQNLTRINTIYANTLMRQNDSAFIINLNEYRMWGLF